MGSVAGQFFKQFGITISVQVFFSLLAARFVTPMLAAYFLKPRPACGAPDGLVMRLYGRILAWSVRHYYMTVGLGLVAFVLALLSTQLLPSGFLPAQDTGRSTLSVELPPGSPLSATQAVTEEIARRLRQRPEVKSVFVDGGHIPPAISEVRVASVIINYTPKEQRAQTQRQLELAIGHDLENIPDIRSWFVDENGMRGISLVVTGQSNAAVRNVAAELATQMRRIPEIANIVSSGSLDRPEIRIRPRQELTARLGIVTDSLAETIRIATIGDVEPALAKMAAGDRQVPVRVQLDQSVRADLQRLEQVRVPMPGGRGSTPLGSIASVALEEGPINIPRYDREQQAGVAADLVEGKVLSQAMAAIDKLPVMKNPPPGIRINASGDSESMNDLAAGFSQRHAERADGGVRLAGVVVPRRIPASHHPVFLAAFPGRRLPGAARRQPAAQRPRVHRHPHADGHRDQERHHAGRFHHPRDRTRRSARGGAVDAGTKRARPIVMTTVAMVAGMLPSAFAHGAGGEFRSPMAIAVIGGLVVSTLLSLVFVPAMYLAMDDLNRLLMRLLSRLLSSRGEKPVQPARAAPAPAALTHTEPTA